jgi:hypothetical protein
MLFGLFALGYRQGLFGAPKERSALLEATSARVDLRNSVVGRDAWVK